MGRRARVGWLCRRVLLDSECTLIVRRLWAVGAHTEREDVPLLPQACDSHARGVGWEMDPWDPALGLWWAIWARCVPSLGVVPLLRHTHC